MPSTIIPDSEAAQEGDLPDGSDKPPLADNQKLSPNSNPPSIRNSPVPPPLKKDVTSSPNVPLPPPEGGAFEKEPGYTHLSLHEHLVSEALSHVKKNSSDSPPTSPSQTASDNYWSPSQPQSRAPSHPPSAAPSRPASRSASMSGGVAGNKVAPPTPKKPTKKPSSVNLDQDKHRFNLKDLLGSAPKLSRRSSQRSDGSGKKSDSDGKSVAGESTGSLSKKYGVCAKVAIGKGATSVVRLAHKWDRTEEKLYAVKEFRKRRKNESEKEYVKKLTAEFCISSTLHHTNIVETVDLVQDENHNWCEVMEFCPGGDLYAAIKKGGMSPSEVECSFKQILTGVSYLHSQGVAHRDIKPENLFFDTKGHLKIGDYGASTVYRLPWEATVHMSTGLCGSEPYIAPEQFLGKPYDARLVDIWACGIVYYCLHFQELPWRAAQSSDALYSSYAAACASPQPAQSACPPTINNLSPRACRPLIRKMLEPNPKLRSPIEEVIKHPWIESVEVCHLVAKPSHVHVNAQQLAAAQHLH